jgi:hypothetical protein
MIGMHNSLIEVTTLGFGLHQGGADSLSKGRV